MSLTIYILYNANATLLGKVTYGYKKICNTSDNPVCAACELTHGGLRLNESAEWKKTKQQIPAEVKQLHRDELPTEVEQFIKSDSLSFPCVLGQKQPGSNPLVLLMSADDINKVSKDHSQFVETLSAKVREKNLPWPDTAAQKL